MQKICANIQKGKKKLADHQKYIAKIYDKKLGKK